MSTGDGQQEAMAVGDDGCALFSLRMLYKTGVGYNKTKKNTRTIEPGAEILSQKAALFKNSIEKTARIRLIFLISISRNRDAQGGCALEVAIL